jgi:hypothetical protein
MSFMLFWFWVLLSSEYLVEDRVEVDLAGVQVVHRELLHDLLQVLGLDVEEVFLVLDPVEVAEDPPEVSALPLVQEAYGYSLLYVLLFPVYDRALA